MADVENGKWYASNGKGNLGVTLGAIGTGLALLGNHGGEGGWGIFGNKSDYVSKETFDKQNEISSLNSKIALLEAEKDSEKKMIDVYERITTRIKGLEDSQAEKWATQNVINAQVGANLSVIQNQISVLNGLTKTIIPIGNVCPQPMQRYNSWTEPTTSSSSGT